MKNLASLIFLPLVALALDLIAPVTSCFRSHLHLDPLGYFKRIYLFFTCIGVYMCESAVCVSKEARRGHGTTSPTLLGPGVASSFELQVVGNSTQNMWKSNKDAQGSHLPSHLSSFHFCILLIHNTVHIYGGNVMIQFVTTECNDQVWLLEFPSLNICHFLPGSFVFSPSSL